MKTISSRKNEKAVHLKKLGISRNYRRERGEFLCDGAKLLREAVQLGADIKTVFTSAELDIEIPETAEIYLVTQDIIDSVSPMKNPQGVLFSCKMPDADSFADVDGRYIILENVQDPGNVGTVIRTAGAFGTDCVILTGACADPYNPKTVRATMGAIFRQRITEVDFDGIADMKKKGIRLYGAALGDDCIIIDNVKWDNSAVIIGSEGQGISEEMLCLCDERVIIPMKPDSESLNAAVAASVFMWEMRKR